MPKKKSTKGKKTSTLPIISVGIAVLFVAIAVVAFIIQSPSTPTPTPPAGRSPTTSRPPVNKDDGQESGFESGIGANNDGCIVGGCSGELCLDESEGNVASPCVFKDEYVCLRLTTCERQTSGECGWTETEEYLACLENFSEASQK